MSNDLTIPEKSFVRHQHVKQLCGDLERTFIQLGEELFWIENDKDYLNLGHDTFNSYLADPDITVGRTMAFMAKEVYGVYVHGLKFESSTVELLEAGVSKLYLVKDQVDADNAWDWINDCCTLSRTDIREKLGKPVQGRSSGNNHRDSYTIELPIYTRDRMENTARHAVLNSYPNVNDDMQNELTKFATDLLAQNVSPDTLVEFWKPRFRRIWKKFRSWKRLAIRSEAENALLKTENAKQFGEILELNERIEQLLDPQEARDKDWRERILENY